MRTLIVITLAVTLYACSFPREVQVQSCEAQLVRIDTVWRYDGDRAWLIWTAEKQIFREFRRLPIAEKSGDKKIILLPR